jgi:cell division protein ZapB
MNNSDSPENSTELDLRKLEVRVDELIRACNHLKDENKSLRTSQENLVAERAALIEKTELARARVEAMITRLKAMESAP